MYKALWGTLLLGAMTSLFATIAHSDAPPSGTPTQTLGAFLTPIDASASSSQADAGRTASRLIDGSGWGETVLGSGQFVHTDNVSEGGSSMWNGDWNSSLVFDLGKPCHVNGMYVWNYNEGSGWNSRGVKDLLVLSSSDGKTYVPVGQFSLVEAAGQEDEPGQAVAFAAALRARYFKFQILSNYRGGEMSGLSEVRFSNADAQAIATQLIVWKPSYPRPTHPRLKIGQPLAGAENIVYPPDFGAIDVTAAPYFAKGDGTTDDTAAIQKALDAHPSSGAIIYLPNGIYRISDTLHWPHGNNPGGEEKETVLQGQSHEGTVLRLPDNCPGFGSPRRPKSPIMTGQAPAQRFGNEIHNLTVDTGAGNPGACGIQFIANNQGGVYDVTIVSGDGQGVKGLDLGYTDEQGPCFIKNVRVQGFDIGVYAATSVASVTLEHIDVVSQNKAGVRNDGQPFTLRDLRSRNAVPALIAAGGFTTVVGAHLSGIGSAAKEAAIFALATLSGRDIRTSGYKAALSDRTAHTQDITGPNLPLFLSRPAASLFGAPGSPLRLAIRETPEAPWNDPKTWVSPQRFGAKVDDGQDDSEAIQKAIDSGASTVYLPRGSYTIAHTIIIRGAVRRIIGGKAFLIIAAPLRGEAQPVFRLAPGTSPVVTLEGINTDFSGGPFYFMEDNSPRTLVLRRLAINFQAADAFHGKGPGTVFIEDVVGHYFKFHHQTVWARQFNVEGDGEHVLNDGGIMWILGLKTEGGGTLLKTRSGGKTELLGSFSYSVGAHLPDPMFVIENSAATLSFGEVCYTGQPYDSIVRQVRGTVTKVMKKADPAWGGAFTLFTASP